MNVLNTDGLLTDFCALAENEKPASEKESNVEATIDKFIFSSSIKSDELPSLNALLSLMQAAPDRVACIGQRCKFFCSMADEVRSAVSVRRPRRLF